MITTPANEMYWLTLEDLRAMNVHIDGQMPQAESNAKRPFRITEKADDGYLNLRSGPGMDYDVIAQMPVGTTVMTGNCVRLEGGLLLFCEVEWHGKHGWASSCCMADLGGLGSPQPPLLQPQVPRKCGAGPRLQVAGCSPPLDGAQSRASSRHWSTATSAVLVASSIGPASISATAAIARMHRASILREWPINKPRNCANLARTKNYQIAPADL
jgi:hypothetical protein